MWTQSFMCKVSTPTLRVWLGLAALSVMLPGCSGPYANFTQEDAFGRTYYIDGAGNWGYGNSSIRQGLKSAGYRGRVIVFNWSPTLNPALDQTVGRPVARSRARDLAEEIGQYCQRYPDGEVNIIALSAGTGVAVWACENLEPPATVHNLVLLGSSLSSNYKMRDALAHITGKVYVYYSNADLVLQGPVRTLGTIDGQLAVDSAGLVGLHPPGGDQDKIVNIPWSARFSRFGWTGAHTDATSRPFVQRFLSRHIVGSAGVADADAAHPQRMAMLTR